MDERRYTFGISIVCQPLLGAEDIAVRVLPLEPRNQCESDRHSINLNGEPPGEPKRARFVGHLEITGRCGAGGEEEQDACPRTCKEPPAPDSNALRQGKEAWAAVRWEWHLLSQGNRQPLPCFKLGGATYGRQCVL